MIRTPEGAFLADICAAPDDDVPRLIFADWLEDQGNADRAEFIREQIHRARQGNDSSQAPMDSREQQLLERHGDAWRADLPSLEGVSWGSFQRGYVEGADFVSVRAFLNHATQVFESAPIEKVRILDVDWQGARRLVEVPFLVQVRELNLGHCNELGRAGVQALAGCPRLANLRSLLLHQNRLGDEALEDLVSSPCLGNLTELYLSGNNLSDRGVAAMGRMKAMPYLAELDLRDNHISNPGAVSLCYPMRRDALATLWLVNNQIGGAGAWALAGTPYLPRLTRLYLNHNPVGDEGAIAFASSTQRDQLRELDLRDCAIGEPGALALANSANLSGLHQLWATGNLFGSRGYTALRQRFQSRLH